MKVKIQQITQSKFLRNVAIVATGTAGAQAITMAFAPIITRLYGPEAFGLLGVFWALLNIVIPIAALTYPMAIVLPKDDRDAKGIAWLAFYIAIAMSSTLAIVLFFWADALLSLMGSQAITVYAMLLPLGMFFAAILQIAEQWVIRKKQFKLTAKMAVYKAFMVGSLQTGIGLMKPISAVLIVVATLGVMFHAVMLFLGVIKANKETERLQEPPVPKADSINKNYSQLASAHKDFPVYRAPQVFINAISMSLPVIMLASFFGPASAGFYTIAMSVLGVPTVLMGKSVSDVFYQRITEASHNRENLTALLLKATGMLAIAGFLPFAIVMVFGPGLFSFVFGAEWFVAGEYAQWLALWLFVSLAAKPSIATIPVIGLQGTFLIYEFISIGIKLVTLLIGFKLFNNDVDTLALFAVVNLFLDAFLIMLITFKSKKV